MTTSPQNENISQRKYQIQNLRLHERYSEHFKLKFNQISSSVSEIFSGQIMIFKTVFTTGLYFNHYR
jgi:hypothetical protein